MLEHEIDYTYDGLYRLTAADYEDEDLFFHYTYDAVGNRLTQETADGGHTYTYDAANRMTSVDGTAYTWDANGNMLSDGTSTYTYNHANRLTGVTGVDVSSFVYNGLGDRYQQIVNGDITTYQLDLAGSLVQVLANGEQTYVYGLETFKQGGRTVISQVSETQTGYYLPDVMGSVRQMTSSEGDLQLAQSYSPYGEELEEIGSEPATFGYAGQLYDEQTGLLFLRARYYSPSSGRFISHDSWAGDAYMPMSYNKWLYGYGNPMRYTDPSGNFALIDTLFAGVLGAAPGAMVGGLVGTCTYDKALTGQCGCDWKQKAFSMTRQEWSQEFMIGGAIIGAILAAAPTIPSITLTGGALIAVGLAKITVGGYTISVSWPRVIDAAQRIAEVGWNWCTVGRFLSEVFVLAGGVALVGSGMGNFVKRVIQSANGVKASIRIVKTWTSIDDLVGETATKLDRDITGSVQSVNRKILDENGISLTELDIELEDVVVEVKSRPGKGSTNQVVDMAEIAGKDVVVYGPKLKGSVFKDLERHGFRVFRDYDAMLNYLLNTYYPYY